MVVFSPGAWNSGTGEWAGKEGRRLKAKRQGQEGRLVGRVVGFVAGWLQLVMSRCLC